MNLDRDALIQAAKDVRERAYAPYSCFAVGAALLTSSGEVFQGCNVENATYGLTMCAERSAIACAVAAGHRDIVAIAIVTATEGPASPCGMCRQTLVEFNPDMVVILTNLRGDTVETTASALLPGAFTGKDLGNANCPS